MSNSSPDATARKKTVYQRLKGPVVPLNICFADDGGVDFAAMRKYVDWLCEQQTPVLLLTYGSSEFAWLSDEDLWRLTEELAQQVRGRSLFITSTGFWPPSVTRRFLQHADKVGADAVKVQVNPWAMSGPPDDKSRILLHYHAAIRDAAPIPLCLWCNSMGQAPVPVDTIAELAHWPDIVGLKNDDDPFYYYYDLIRATRDCDFAVVSGGQMRNFIFGFQLGSTAYLCTVAPFRPDIANRFHQALLDGRIDDAWEMVYQYEERWLQGALKLDWLQTIKTAIQLHGLLPRNALGGNRPGQDAGQRAQVRQLLEQVFGSLPVATS